MEGLASKTFGLATEFQSMAEIVDEDVQRMKLLADTASC